MEVYIVIIHDWEENEHYPLGVYSSKAEAGRAMDGHMAAEHGFSEFSDWEHDHDAGCSYFFYDGFTVEIQRAQLDEDLL